MLFRSRHNGTDDLLNKVWRPQYPHTLPTADDTCAVGLEVEVENCPRFGEPNQNIWTTHADNSLREHGIEFVSTPIYGTQVWDALNILYDHILPEKASFSQRTSIHVHVDMSSLTLEQLAQTVITYLAVERVLYEFVGNGREHNIFCVPILDTPSVRKLAIICQSGSELFENSALTGEEFRYSGLDRKSTRLNSSHIPLSRMPSSA